MNAWGFKAGLATGFVAGAVVAGAAFFFYLHHGGRRTVTVVIPPPDAGAPPKAKSRRPRVSDHSTLSAAELRAVSQGDDLSRPEIVRLEMDEPQDERELTQDDIDARFRPQEPEIIECISRARPDADTYIPGRVTIQFRIQRAGTVRGVRVEAPAIMHKAGLYACIKALVGKLRFPASGGSQTVSYPFSLG